MRQVQLNSGKVSDYVPIGQAGQPIYKNADAFRSALSMHPKVGPESINILAIARLRDDCEHIDWYIPFSPTSVDGQYHVVSWVSASESERAEALTKINEFESTLREIGAEFSRRGGDSHDKLFASYLTGQSSVQNLPAVHFPDENCVFIVDGQPVITFWGFCKSTANLASSPFQALRQAPATGFAGAAAMAGSAGASATPNYATKDNTVVYDDPHRNCKRFLAWGLLIAFLIGLLLLLASSFFSSCQRTSFVPLDNNNANEQVDNKELLAAKAQDQAAEQAGDSAVVGEDSSIDLAAAQSNVALDAQTTDSSATNVFENQDANVMLDEGLLRNEEQIFQAQSEQASTGTTVVESNNHYHHIIIDDNASADVARNVGTGDPFAALEAANSSDNAAYEHVLLDDAGTDAAVTGNATQDPALATEGSEALPSVDPALDNLGTDAAADVNVPLDPVLNSDPNAPVEPTQPVTPVTPVDPDFLAIDEASADAAQDPAAQGQTAVGTGVPTQVPALAAEPNATGVSEPNTLGFDPLTNTSPVQNQVPNNLPNNALPPVDSHMNPNLPAINFTPEELASLGVKVMDGYWETRSPLMDSTNGRPLNVDYQINEGKGEVIVTRPNKMQCRAPLDVAVENNEAVLKIPERASCPDGRTYLLPEVKCKPSSQAKVLCQGKIAGQSFPIRLYSKSAQ